MDDFTFYLRIRQHDLEFDTTLINHALAKSKGLPVMSEEDVKTTILSLYGMVRTQKELIEFLHSELAKERKEKKSFGRKLFRK